MKYFTLLGLFFLFSCANKEDVLLPKSNFSIVKEVNDLSPIYIFFRTNGKDTLAEVNRKNSIISTNWILNIDKRLPLLLVIPEVMKLQQKKREEKAHKNEKAENYYSYADTIGSNLAFIPFTTVFYKMEKPLSTSLLFYFYKDRLIINDSIINKVDLLKYLSYMPIKKDTPIILCFDKNSSFGDYIENKVFIKRIIGRKKTLKIDQNQEFIF